MTYRRLLGATVGATYGLILLGIYTAAIGAGLTCDGRWPLCDGAVFGLFPANWPSFVEWFHRLVALITGFMILASWWVVWRGNTSRRAVVAMSLAVALLPIQIWLGAETVLSYELLTLTAHFLTALLIFTGLLLGSTWAMGLERIPTPWIRRMLVGALVLMIPLVLLTPQFLVIHRGEVQLTYYGIGLVIFTGTTLLAAFSETRSIQLVGGLTTILIAIQLLAGRLVRSPLMEATDWVAAGLTVALLLVGLWLTTRIESPPQLAGASAK